MAAAKKFCTECGEALTAKAKTCKKCGAPVDLEATIKDETAQAVEAVVSEEIKEETVKAEIPAIEEPCVEEDKPVPQTREDGLLEEEEKRPRRRAEEAKPVVSDPAPARRSRYAPVSTFSFILMDILLLIPVVNIILLFVWARANSRKINRRNFARAALIVLLLLILWAAASYFFGDVMYGGLVTKYAGFLEGIGLESIVNLWGK